MRVRALAVSIAIAVGLLPAVTHAGRVKTRGPFLLVSLSSLGTVTWRCIPGPTAAKIRYALGFRAFTVSATDRVRLLEGARVVRRLTVQPGESVRFPALGRVQGLELVQQTGAGTLRASVTVRFETPAVAPYCYAYLPPRVSVTVSPRS